MISFFPMGILSAYLDPLKIKGKIFILHTLERSPAKAPFFHDHTPFLVNFRIIETTGYVPSLP